MRSGGLRWGPAAKQEGRGKEGLVTREVRSESGRMEVYRLYVELKTRPRGPRGCSCGRKKRYVQGFLLRPGVQIWEVVLA